MNDMSDHDLFGEPALRRALQLDDDERAPLLDAAAIAVAAGARTPVERIGGLIRGLLLVGAGVAAEALVGVAAFNALGNVDLTGPLSLALSIFAAAAEQTVRLAALTANPSVGLAALAAVIFATIHERAMGRESSRVRAS